jgi:peptide/nickel transport system substrate-binding protein
MVFERNPYYFKLDTAGNQLPYLDRVTYEMVESAEVLNLMAMDGAFDWMERDVARIEQLPLVYDNAERGDYRVFQAFEENTNFACIIQTSTIRIR